MFSTFLHRTLTLSRDSSPRDSSPRDSSQGTMLGQRKKVLRRLKEPMAAKAAAFGAMINGESMDNNGTIMGL